MCVCYVCFNQQGLSVSPSFSRGEIIDSLGDWQPRTAVCDDIESPIIKQLFSAPDIAAVSYYSDGKILNGALMLNSSLKGFMEHPFKPELYFQMVVQPSSHYETPGRHAAVYADEVYYDHNTGKWVRWIYEKFSNGVNREIYRNNNYTGFFDKDNKFISFSLDLNLVGSPSEYLLNFATLAYGNVSGQWCSLKDDVVWHQIPIPKFSISSSPSSIELRPGEEKDVEIIVTSPLKRSGYSNVTITSNSTNELSIAPNISKIALFGETSSSSIFTFRASDKLNDDKLPKIRTILTDLFITIPGYTQQHEGPDIKSASLTSNISETFSDLKVTIQKRLTFEEKFISFWNAYGSVISLIGGGFAAGFTALVFDRIKKKKDDTK